MAGLRERCMCFEKFLYFLVGWGTQRLSHTYCDARKLLWKICLLLGVFF